jgi:hypothetical protein
MYILNFILQIFFKKYYGGEILAADGHYKR